MKTKKRLRIRSNNKIEHKEGKETLPMSTNRTKFRLRVYSFQMITAKNIFVVKKYVVTIKSN